MPRISVIMPVYQAEQFLERSVGSVLDQSFQDWELLLVDDGCRDGSPALCDRFASRDPRVRVFHRKKNAGVSEARNLGLHEAKGDYIAFLDADDAFLPAALATLLELAERAGADSAGCAHLNVAPDGGQRPERLLPAGEYDAAGIREHIVYPLLGDRLQVPVFNGFIWRFLFSAKLLRGIAFEGAYLEDELFLMEYFLHAQKLAMVDKPLYLYLQNPASVTRRYLPRYREEFQRFLERKRALVQRYGLDGLCPGWEDNTCWAGLLIAVGNEFAPGNSKSMGEKSAYVKELCSAPEFARAMANLKPNGLAGNKGLVAKLLLGRHFTLLALLYRIKNRGK